MVSENCLKVGCLLCCLTVLDLGYIVDDSGREYTLLDKFIAPLHIIYCTQSMLSTY